MTPWEAMTRIDTLLAHVWMVRAFLKHCEESEEDEDLAEVHRTLYDYMLALGPSLQANDAPAYLKQANKKYKKLLRAMELFGEIQPEISNHTNFQMAVRSLQTAVAQIGELLIQACASAELAIPDAGANNSVDELTTPNND
jgi:cob(I)alamin adenosyltransferase